jgi:peptidyl-prolyl cis-trans isomerase SurA
MTPMTMLTRSLHRILATVLLGSLTALSVAQTDAPNLVKGDFIVAIVGSQAVTNHEVRVAAAQLSDEQFNRDGKRAPLSSLLSVALEKVINDKALLDFATEARIEIDNIDIDQAEQRMAAQAQETVDQLRKDKLKQGISLQEFRKEIKNQLMIQKLTERSVVSRIKITDQDIDAVVQTHSAQTTEPNVEVELAQIFLTIPESATANEVKQIEKKAQSLHDQLDHGADFASLARDYSEGTDRAKGGSMGMRPLNRYPELFVQNATNLRLGAISPVFRSGAGLHILKLVDKRSSNQIQITETHARHILIRSGSGVTIPAAKAMLSDYRNEIVNGKNTFADLAKAHSQDGSAAQGGDLGWVAPGSFVPEFENVMNKLALNELSEPVVSRFGVHLIQVLERRTISVSEREFREMVRNQLRAERYDATYKDWVKETRGQVYVEYLDAPR